MSVTKLTRIVIAANHRNPACIAAIIMISLLQKPLKGGMPAIDSEAMVQVALVKGICSRSPPISFNCLVPVLYSMEPEHRKSKDLNTEWLAR